jgi:hypothetical protein
MQCPSYRVIVETGGTFVFGIHQANKRRESARELHKKGKEWDKEGKELDYDYFDIGVSVFEADKEGKEVGAFLTGVGQYLHTPIYYPANRLMIHLFIFISIHLSTYVYIYLLYYLSIHPSIY